MKRLSKIAFIAAIAAACFTSSAIAQESVIVTNRVIYPGQTVTANDIRVVQLKQNRDVRAYVTKATQIAGKIADKTILPNRFIVPAMLREAYAVNKGRPVQVTYERGALSITIMAVALQDGSPGDMVTLRNADSGQTFNGVVLADGTVRVGA
ncbi:flagellar basal body P-ring formation chaperone FlgA [Limoniibacter endophyticus]|uniref:Flagella basal body P-ring formation protein FlgA n=1 Tax=Limoniibacter endophyticus TaxID=1565040 RepID=A0A8J3GGB6_9HYPH|nr:flagellar basal body P-ring formation chaperone FlgA [Limoniibacter endophyticus]GHC64571.1 flagella basal body P-ring formation protein FlgA [Limoniibacter endophyticus]